MYVYNMYYIIIVFLQSLEAFSSNYSEVLLNQSAIVTSQLAEATARKELPLFPTDLQITNSLIHSVINILEDNVDVLQQSSVIRPDVVCNLLNLFVANSLNVPCHL